MEIPSTLCEINITPMLAKGTSTIILFTLGWLISGWLSQFFSKMLLKTKVDTSVTVFVQTFLTYALRALVGIFALANIGIDTTSLAAVVGATGLAIGFALRNTLSNVAAGILLVSLRPFRIGDLVQAGGKTGTVKEISVFHTLFKEEGGCEITIPNGSIFNGPITNFTQTPSRRWELSLDLPYDTEISLIREIITETLHSEKNVLESPKPDISITDLTGYGITVMVRIWIPTKGFRGTKVSVLEQIHSKLRSAGIVLAKKYPET